MEMDDNIWMNYPPVEGSWVAELEEAKADLLAWYDEEGEDDDDDDYDDDDDDDDDEKKGSNEKGRDDNDDDEEEELRQLHVGLDAHARVCRAYLMLRRWDKLLKQARAGSELVSDLSTLSSSSSSSSSSGSESSSWAQTFQNYRNRAQAELAKENYLHDIGPGETSPSSDGTVGRARSTHALERHDDNIFLELSLNVKSFYHGLFVKEGKVPDMLMDSRSHFGNATTLQEAVLNGDVRLMELLVGLGCSLDRSFRDDATVERVRNSKIMVPTSATALVAACVVLAVADSTNPRWPVLKMKLPRSTDVVDGIATCAMQLVNLGADVDRKYLLQGLDPLNTDVYVPDLEGKTAFQIAAMTKRRELVAAMVEHKKVSPTERAETLVHCRCGSRLPWRKCHSTGIGQPPHYITKEDGRIYFRVSPSARCPCGVTPKTYYRCCWRDNGKPTYMDDKTGFHFGNYLNGAASARERVEFCLDENDPAHASFLVAYHQGTEGFKESVRRIRESEEYFLELCRQWGPKSKISTWNRDVYAGCLERLKEGFYWTDVHWDLDRTELGWRVKHWNTALESFCNDTHLFGEARALVVARHTAHPCAPCGYVGCTAVENEIRQFQRCSRCKKIAYCSIECQLKDWRASHKKACKEASVVDDGPASRM